MEQIRQKSIELNMRNPRERKTHLPLGFSLRLRRTWRNSVRSWSGTATEGTPPPRSTAVLIERGSDPMTCVHGGRRWVEQQRRGGRRGRRKADWSGALWSVDWSTLFRPSLPFLPEPFLTLLSHLHLITVQSSASVVSITQKLQLWFN